MKYKIEIEVEIPDTNLSSDIILQEIGDHIIGDARRYQAVMRVQALENNDQLRSNHHKFWFDVLETSNTNVMKLEE